MPNKVRDGLSGDRLHLLRLEQETWLNRLVQNKRERIDMQRRLARVQKDILTLEREL